jgi:uncharacterized protein (UPF0264 family)
VTDKHQEPKDHARNPPKKQKHNTPPQLKKRDKNFKGSKTPHVCDAQLKLLISPINETEALEAIRGGADIIDVKNPVEGALGANYPWVIKNIKQLIPKGTELSCTLGDVPNLPGSISLAAYGAATLGVDYIKVGLYGFINQKDAIYLLQQVCKAAKTLNPHITVVAAGYADAEKIGTLSPQLIPKIAKTAGADIAMLDTATKNGTNLFTYQTTAQLEAFIQTAHKNGLQAALAGSLRKQDIPTIKKLGADIVGLRGAACTNNDRNIGHITHNRVKELVAVMQGAGKA